MSFAIPLPREARKEDDEGLALRGAEAALLVTCTQTGDLEVLERLAEAHPGIRSRVAATSMDLSWLAPKGYHRL